MGQPAEKADAAHPHHNHQTVSFVDTSDPRCRALVTAAYEQVFAPVFSDELDSLEKILGGLEGDTPIPNMNFVITIVGENLDQPQGYEIYGASLAYYYGEDRIGYLVYNAKKPGVDVKGLGKEMIDARREALEALAARDGGSISFLTFDIHDPKKFTAGNDAMDPQARENMFLKMGAVELPFTLILPPPQEGDSPLRDNKLMHWPIPGQTEADVCSFAKGFLTRTWGEVTKGHPEAHPEFHEAIAELEKWEGRITQKFQAAAQGEPPPPAALPGVLPPRDGRWLCIPFRLF